MFLYIVRNKEGKYFRSKGYGGSGSSWVDDLKKARFYANFGAAQARVTWWYKHFPEFGKPDILEFQIIVDLATVIND